VRAAALIYRGWVGSFHWAPFNLFNGVRSQVRAATRRSAGDQRLHHQRQVRDRSDGWPDPGGGSSQESLWPRRKTGARKLRRLTLPQMRRENAVRHQHCLLYCVEINNVKCVMMIIMLAARLRVISQGETHEFVNMHCHMRLITEYDGWIKLRCVQFWVNCTINFCTSFSLRLYM